MQSLHIALIALIMKFLVNKFPWNSVDFHGDSIDFYENIHGRSWTFMNFVEVHGIRGRPGNVPGMMS